MTELIFDTEYFIGEVSKRPILWNTKLESFRDRDRKQQAWIELASSMYPTMKGDELRKRAELLLKKWRNIRDNYMRDIRRPPGDIRNSKKKPYLYRNECTFLNCTFSVKPKENALVEHDYFETSNPGEKEYDNLEENFFEHVILQAESVDGSEMPLGILETETSGRELSDQNQSVSDTPENSTERLMKVIPEGYAYRQDDDQSFFDSILPIVRQFGVDKKLEFRIQVMSVIQKLRKS